MIAPKLRFKDFNDEWKKEKLETKVNSISSGKIKPTENGDFLVYGSTGVIGKAEEYSHDGDYILVARVGANAGFINRVNGKFAVTDNTLVIDLKKETDVSFLQAYLTNYNLNKLIFGSGQPLITGGLLKAIEYTYPSLTEQKKIAGFLSAVDEKIQLLNRKKQLLEQYKKGVMQQLFSGKLRFKDENGKAYPKWEEKKLGEIGEFKNGINKGKEDFGFGFPFVNLMDVFGKSTISDLKLDLVNANEKELKLYELKKGDVLFIRSSVKKSGVGETSLVLKDLANTVFSGFLIRFRDEKHTLHLDFKKYCFSTTKFRNDLISLSSTSANTNINQESLNTLVLDIPCLEEQKKIADFLSAIDIKIESLSTQINQTKNFKKGLLQQMFV